MQSKKHSLIESLVNVAVGYLVAVAGQIMSCEYSGTWLKSGMIVNGTLYPLPSVEHHTSENESGLLPTPTAGVAMMGYCVRDAKRVMNNEKRESGAQIGRSLRWEPALLPYYKTGLKSQWVNPRLCEWMMGYPLNWVSLKPVEMGGFHRWLKEFCK